MNARSKGILATVLAALVWSTAGLFIKLLPQSAFTILCYRALYTMGFFYILFRKEVFRFNKQMWINAFFYAGLLITFVSATKLTTAANAIFLQYTGAAYILLLEPLLFKTGYSRINIITTTICFLGMGLFLQDGLTSSSGWGMPIAVLSGLFFAALFLGQKANPHTHHVAAIFWGNFLVALIGFSDFWASAPATLNEHAMLAFLGIIQMGIGYALFTYGLKLISATEASLITMLEPLFNPVWVIIGLGEMPSKWSIIGGGIVIAALVFRLFIMKWQRKRLKYDAQ